MLAESWFKIGHLLKVMNKPWSHFTLELWFSSQKISHHFFFTYKTISVRGKKYRSVTAQGTEQFRIFSLQKARSTQSTFFERAATVLAGKKPLEPCGSYPSSNSKHWTYSMDLGFSPVHDITAQTRPLSDGSWLTAHTGQALMPLADHQPWQPKRFWTTRIIKPSWLGNIYYIYLLEYLLPSPCYTHSFPLSCTQLVCFISLMPGLDTASPLQFDSTPGVLTQFQQEFLIKLLHKWFLKYQVKQDSNQVGL